MNALTNSYAIQNLNNVIIPSIMQCHHNIYSEISSYFLIKETFKSSLCSLVRDWVQREGSLTHLIWLGVSFFWMRSINICKCFIRIVTLIWHMYQPRKVWRSLPASPKGCKNCPHHLGPRVNQERTSTAHQQ